MATKDITPLQYAEWYGCTLQNVTKQLRKHRELLGVIRIKKFSRFYLLEVDKKMDAQSFEEIKKKSESIVKALKEVEKIRKGIKKPKSFDQFLNGLK